MIVLCPGTIFKIKTFPQCTPYMYIVIYIKGSKLLQTAVYIYIYTHTHSQLPLNRHLVKADTSKADTWSWSLLYFSHLLNLPPRRTPLYGGKSELVPSVSALEGFDCIPVCKKLEPLVYISISLMWTSLCLCLHCTCEPTLIVKWWHTDKFTICLSCLYRSEYYVEQIVRTTGQQRDSCKWCRKKEEKTVNGRSCGKEVCCNFNPFNPKLIIQILPTIQEENDWAM